MRVQLYIVVMMRGRITTSNPIAASAMNMFRMNFQFCFDIFMILPIKGKVTAIDLRPPLHPPDNGSLGSDDCDRRLALRSMQLPLRFAIRSGHRSILFFD